MKEGAADFLTKPVDTDHLLLLLDRAIERRRAAHRATSCSRRTTSGAIGLPKVLGEDPALKETMLAIQRAAATDATVLILGRERHRQGADGRAAAPALAAGQGALRGHQLRRHPRGPARERAVRPREGRLHRRQRAARSARPSWRTAARSSSTRSATCPCRSRPRSCASCRRSSSSAWAACRRISVDVRVVAATNRDLQEAVAAEGSSARTSSSGSRSSRSRSRRCAAGAATSCSWPRPSSSATPGRWGASGLRLSEARSRALLDHSWPGNVRELQNCLERAVILCDGLEVEPEHLRLGRGRSGGPALGDVLDLSGPLAEVVRRARGRAPRTRRSRSPCARRGRPGRGRRAGWASASRP